MSRTLDFDFKKLTGPQSNTKTADGESRPFDEYLSTRVDPIGGRLLILNGVNANSQIPRVAALTVYGGSQPNVVPLVMAAPSATLFPMLSWAGEGRIFGTDYVWRIRHKNSQTGDVSGMSPIPAWRISMGQETTQGANTYVGQKAFFNIPCSSSDVPAYCDTIQLLRNVSGDEKVWYVEEEKQIPSGASYLFFEDNTTDEELILRDSAGLQPNPSYDEGPVPPYVKAFEHATGELWLYGHRPMGPYRSGTVSVTVGSTTVTRTDTTTCFDGARVGQRFRMTSYGGNTVDDVTVYRICSIPNTGATMQVTPPIQPSTYLPTLSTTYTTVSFEIIDDIGTSTVQPSLAGMPANYDLLDAFGIGFDTDDQLCAIFTLRGITYGHTTRGIYRLLNDVSTDVNATIAAQKVSDDGIAGFEAGALTPFGWAFVCPKRGVLLFDGNAPPLGYETLGTVSPCVPLGSEDESEPFRPTDQFFGAATDAYSAYTGMYLTGFEETLISECRVWFDEQTHLLHVFYVPKGMWTMSEELCFDADSKCWRGPWRRCATAAGTMRNADGTDIFVFGDDVGNISIDQRQAWDVLATAPAAATTNASGTGYVLVASGTPFDATTYKEEGVPVALYSPTGGTPVRAFQMARIIDVIDNATLVLDTYALESGLTYTYQLAAIRWLLQTAWLDSDEPIQPKEAERLRVRVVKAASGASDATIAVCLDGDESLANMTGELQTPFTLTSYSTEFPAWRDVRLSVGSRLFAVVAYGTSITGDPKMTKVVMDLRVDSGA